MRRLPPRSTLDRSSAASDVYKRQAGFLPLIPDPQGGLVVPVAAATGDGGAVVGMVDPLSLIHISEPTRPY